MQVTYAGLSGGIDLIDRITTNDGRSVHFVYEGYVGGSSPPLAGLKRLQLVEARYNGALRERWQYKYDLVPGTNHSHLTEAIGPEDLVWTYDYDTSPIGRGQLNHIEGPYGATKTITYQAKGSPISASNPYSAVHTIVNGGPDVPTATWTYGYEAPPSAWTDITTVVTPSHREVHTFCGERFVAVGGTAPPCAHRIGKIISKEIYPLAPQTAPSVQREEFVWDSRSDLTNQLIAVRWATGRAEPAWNVLVEHHVIRGATRFVNAQLGFENTTLTSEWSQDYIQGSATTRTRQTTYHVDLANWIVQPNFEVTEDLQLTLANGTIIDVGSNGKSTTYTAQGTVHTVTQGGVTSTNTYDAGGNLDYYTRPGDGGDFDVIQTQLGIPTQLLAVGTNAMLHRTLTSRGYLHTETDWEGHATTYDYDDLGRVVRIETPKVGDHDTTITRDFKTRLETVTRGLFAEIKRMDAMGRVIETERAGTKVRTEYDAAGRKVFVSDMVDASTTLPSRCVPALPSSCASATCSGTCTEYDVLGRVTSVRYTGDGTTTTYDYTGPLTTVMTNAVGQVTTFVHERFGDPDEHRPVEIQEEEGVTTEVDYYRNGQVYRIAQGAAASSTVDQARYRILDADNRLILDINPESGERILTYDGRGRLASTYFDAPTPDDQNSITFTYDDSDRIESYGPTAGMPVEYIVFTYDDNSRLATAAHENSTWTYTYDPNGNRDSETLAIDGRAFAIGRGWNANDYLEWIEYPDGQKIEFEPDTVGRPTKVGDLVSGVAYYPNGMIDRMVYANGDIINHVPDSKKPSLVATIDGGPIALDYEYDSIGNMLSMEDRKGGSSNSFLYDRLNRMTRFNGSNGKYTIAYDDKNNRQSITQAGRTTSYEWGYNVPTAGGTYHPHVLVGTLGDIATSFEHDWRGNVRRSIEYAGLHERKHDDFEYSWMNRITSHQHREYGEHVNPQGQTIQTIEHDVIHTYAYDAFGNRVERDMGQYFVYSGGQLLYEEDPVEGIARKHFFLGTIGVAQETEDCTGSSAGQPWCPITNQPPKIVITSPRIDARPDHRTPVTLSALAVDRESGDLTSAIDWFDASTAQSAVPNPTMLLDSGGTITRTFSPGEHRLEARVQDASGQSSTATIRLRVEIGPNTAPSTQQGPLTVTAQVGQLLEVLDVDDWFTDADGDAMTVSASQSMPSWLTFDGSTLSGTPTNMDSGGVFEFSAFDGAESSPTVEVNVVLNIPGVVWYDTTGVNNYSGTGGDDELHGLGGSDDLRGLGGNDVIYGGADGDLLYGGPGNDELYGEGGNDDLFGEAGDDLLVPGIGNGVVNGGDGDDTYQVEYGPQQIVDPSGNDTIEWVGWQVDDLSFQYEQQHGSVPNTSFVYVYALNGYHVAVIQQGLSLPPAIDSVSFGVGGTPMTIDALIARLGPATSGNDQFFGGPGDDTLLGLDGADLLAGGGGNDLLDGGAGADRLFGDEGNDTFVVDGSSSDIIADSDGFDTIEFPTVASTQIVVTRTTFDLYFHIIGNPSYIAWVRNYFLQPQGSSTTPYKIEQVTFTDVTWNQTQLENAIQP